MGLLERYFTILGLTNAAISLSADVDSKAVNSRVPQGSAFVPRKYPYLSTAGKKKIKSFEKNKNLIWSRPT
jgi:hypothetical protein